MRSILDECDWSGSIRDLRLAVAVLKDDYSAARKLMTEIGRQGEVIHLQGYLYWPIFREFRRTEQFADGFKEVYGRPFNEAVAEDAGTNDGTESSDVDRIVA